MIIGISIFWLCKVQSLDLLPVIVDIIELLKKHVF